MTELRFLGWSEDGRSFVLRTAYGRDMGELDASDRLELIQAHDSLTGKMMRSFRLARRIDKGLERAELYEKAWAEASPKREWKAYRATHRLTGHRGAARPPDGWSLSAEPASTPQHGKLTLKREIDHIATAWEGFGPELKQTAGRGEPGPGVRLLGVKGGRQTPLLVYRVPYDLRDIAGCVDYTSSPGRAVGAARAFWSPKRSPIGARVLLTLEANLEGWTEEDPRNEVRYYLRTLGPQIQLVSPAEGEASARALAEKLAAAGLAVTQLSLTGKPREKTLIYHRGSGGAELARRMVKALGGQAEISALSKPGWLDLVVLLGAR